MTYDKKNLVIVARQTTKTQLTVVACPVQSRALLIIPHLHLLLVHVRHDHLHANRMAAGRREVQDVLPINVGGVHVGVSGEQELDYAVLSVHDLE